MKMMALLALAMLLGFAGCAGVREEIDRTRAMEIENVDLSKVTDGTYQGSYSYANKDFVVEVTVRDHTIEKIDIVEAFTGTKYARGGQVVIDTVLANQSLDVDVITGSTTSSKAYLKAIENALRKGLVE